MKVLLTGAFGNVGVSTIEKLAAKQYQIRCFDIQSSKNMKVEKKAKKTFGDFETVWGDILDELSVKEVVKGIDAIIHLAAIIPPLSEKIPDVAYKVNVLGTKNLLHAAKQENKKIRFIVASSISVYGSTMAKEPPRKVTDELAPLDNYSSHKIEVEKLIKESGLEYLILRLAAVSIPKIPNRLDPIMFEIPLNQRIEFVDTRDCGTAFANAVESKEVNKTFNIGGGKGCQIVQREYFEELFKALGISMLPDSAFRTPKSDDDWFYTDWVDTEDAQRALQFQSCTFKDYVKEIRNNYNWRRFGASLVKPFVKLSLLIMSPYYKFTSKDEKEFKEFDHHKIMKLINANQNRIEALEKRVSELEAIIKDL
ncbi:MAG: NAD-dependent epimerase/dehydratase family protein [Promethearchaeota archaeon]